VIVKLFLILVGFFSGYLSGNLVESFQLSIACVWEFVLPRLYA
jgi:hypothetical protein